MPADSSLAGPDPHVWVWPRETKLILSDYSWHHLYTISKPRSSHQDNFRWQPGQTLPLPSTLPPYVCVPDSPDITRGRHTDSGTITSEVVDLLRTFQHSLDSKLQTVCAKLENIDSRMANIESRRKKKYGSVCHPVPQQVQVLELIRDEARNSS